MVRWVSADLRVEGRQPGFRVIEHCLMGAGVDAEQQIAFFTRWLSRMGISTMRPLTLGHYIDGISIDMGVIGLRRGLQLPDNEDQRQDGGRTSSSRGHFCVTGSAGSCHKRSVNKKTETTQRGEQEHQRDVAETRGRSAAASLYR